jgi:hypothetical protein
VWKFLNEYHFLLDSHYQQAVEWNRSFDGCLEAVPDQKFTNLISRSVLPGRTVVLSRCLNCDFEKLKFVNQSMHV